MEMSKLHQTIWKINGVLTLVVGILASIGLSLLISEFATSKLRPHGVRNVIEQNPEAVLKEKLEYQLNSITSNMVVVDLVTDQRIETKYGSKDASNSLRNQIFIELTTQMKTVLFPNNKYLITDVFEMQKDSARLTKSWNTDGQSEVIARVYSVVQADSDGDSRLTEKDRKTIMIAKANGKSLTTLIPNYDGYMKEPKHQAGIVSLLAEPSTENPTLIRFDTQNWQLLATIPISHKTAGQ